MQYRTLGRTGLKVSEIGYGAWGIGKGFWVGADDQESLRALNKAIDLGLNLIDTARVYGKGHSEKLVGEVIRKRSEEIYVATKIPPKKTSWPPKPGTSIKKAFPNDYIIKTTDDSLKALNLDHIDVQQFHTWLDEWTDESEWQEGIQKLKEQGKIRFFGVSIIDHQPDTALQLATSGLVDTFQVIYNIFDQKPAENLLPLCQELNIGTLIRVPFDEGALTGKITSETTFPEGDWRNDYFKGDRKRQVEERVDSIKSVIDGTGMSVAEAALRFTLSHPATSTVIPGMRTVKHAEANCAVSDGNVLSKDILGELKKQAWDKNFYE